MTPHASPGRGVPRGAAAPATRAPAAPTDTAPASNEGDVPSLDAVASGLEGVRAWMNARGWAPFEFQERTWAAYLSGRSGLVQVPTGAGKTYAALLGPVAELIDEARSHQKRIDGIRLLYLTPLRAVSRDVELAIRAPIEALGMTRQPFGVTVESRTGDTSTSTRRKQKDRLPTVLITTPESLCVLLTDESAAERFSSLRAIVCDEWHELLSSKRGSQTELALARLRRWAPGVRSWALSATVGNPQDAAGAVVGANPANPPEVITADLKRPIHVSSLAPPTDRPFPWAGHLGMPMLTPVLEELDAHHDAGRTTLVFVNTRSQAELWFNAIRHHRPAWEGTIGVHHGSIERERREEIEAGLKSGSLSLVVATSSLDLGVDFAPVDRVLQIGSVKGVARLVQRAGRGAHRPGEPCEVVCVPTHALEYVEIAAVREAIQRGDVEDRFGEPAPLDVLAQHLVTVALGGGFTPDAVFDEVRTAHAFRGLTREEFDWTLALVEHGGKSLNAYAQYRRIAPDEQGVYRVPDDKTARLHRFNIGTITSDGTIEVRYLSGRSLGRIEESFIAALRKGERFVFAGKVLEFVTLHDAAAMVRRSSGRSNHTPRWAGTKLPISENLAASVREMLQRVRDGDRSAPELVAAAPFIEQQARMSALPGADELLIEHATTREGAHLFVFPFEGRLVHGGLAAIVALRLGRIREGTFAIAANDYGFEILADADYPFEALFTNEIIKPEGLGEDALESMNVSQMAKRQFRDVARVAGLVMQNYPGGKRRHGHVTASSSLIFDVLEEFEPDHLLLHQARREVLDRQFEQGRLRRLVDRLAASRWVRVRTDRPTPLSLPLLVERIGARLSTESVLKRVQRLTSQWDS